MYGSLTLGELWCTTCAVETWLLAFLRAAIAAEESGLLQFTAEFWVQEEECAADTVADCITLSGLSASCDECLDINVLLMAGEEQRSDRIFDLCACKVFLEFKVIHRCFTCSVLEQFHTGDGSLSLADAIEVGALGVHKN